MNWNIESHEFIKCDTCRAKPGTPLLCSGCLHNRAVIGDLKKCGEIECIDAIRAALTPEEFRGFCNGNALKYAWRERLKGGDQDLRKAAWYLSKLTEANQ